MRPVLVLALGTFVLGSAGAAHAESPLPSCEEVASGYVDDLSKRGASRDLTSSDYGQILNDGGYLSACNVPSEMTLKICAAVQNGKAAGVTVTTDPVDGDVADCVRAQVAALAFPSSAKLDVARTTFAPAEKDGPPMAPTFSETPNNAPPPVEPKKSGCGCSMPGMDTRAAGWGAALALAALVRLGGAARSRR